MRVEDLPIGRGEARQALVTRQRHTTGSSLVTVRDVVMATARVGGACSRSSPAPSGGAAGAARIRLAGRRHSSGGSFDAVAVTPAALSAGIRIGGVRGDEPPSCRSPNHSVPRSSTSGDNRHRLRLARRRPCRTPRSARSPDPPHTPPPVAAARDEHEGGRQRTADDRVLRRRGPGVGDGVRDVICSPAATVERSAEISTCRSADGGGNRKYATGMSWSD